MLSENEQGFVNVCGTSSVQANSEAAEVADEIDRMIEKDRSLIELSRTYGHLSFFQETGPLLLFDWLRCAVHTGTKGL
jgi:hypothetical protein